MTSSYHQFSVVGIAIDPVHVGTGGERLGRVDLSIVRDPVTRVPKIPGSSLAGAYRTYAAMRQQEANSERHFRPQPYYPDCAGQGQPDGTGKSGHCAQPNCPICIVFGFARGTGGGFAGLAAFSDGHVLLFPVATREGPVWITCPDALRRIGRGIDEPLEDAVYQRGGAAHPLNLGWLLLERKATLPSGKGLPTLNWNIPSFITQRMAIVPDRLFSHIVNSNLEVRTSVAIDAETGAAQEHALFSYEALPRGTVLVWDVVCKNPSHFKVGGQEIKATIDGKPIRDPNGVFSVVQTAHPYLEYLGIGGMGTRGMGRLRVIFSGLRSNDGGQPEREQVAKGGRHEESRP